jgi:hypothetical protein
MLKAIRYFAAGTFFRLLLIPIFCMQHAEAQAPVEYSVKAAFVYNFLKYVEWPDPAGCKATNRFKLGIRGINPFDNAFDKFKGKPIERCFLEISDISESQLLEQFQAVFICNSEKERLKSILAGLNALPVLTIGDTAGFMQEGVMINLIKRDDKLGFEINMKAARAAGIKISSQLLKLAFAIQE